MTDTYANHQGPDRHWFEDLLEEKDLPFWLLFKFFDDLVQDDELRKRHCVELATEAFRERLNPAELAAWDVGIPPHDIVMFEIVRAVLVESLRELATTFGTSDTPRTLRLFQISAGAWMTAWTFDDEDGELPDRPGSQH